MVFLLHSSEIEVAWSHHIHVIHETLPSKMGLQKHAILPNLSYIEYSHFKIIQIFKCALKSAQKLY